MVMKRNLPKPGSLKLSALTQKPRDKGTRSVAALLSQLFLICYFSQLLLHQRTDTEKGPARHAGNRIVLRHEALILQTLHLWTVPKGAALVQTSRRKKSPVASFARWLKSQRGSVTNAARAVLHCWRSLKTLSMCRGRPRMVVNCCMQIFFF